IVQGGLMFRPVAVRRAWPLVAVLALPALAGCHTPQTTPSGPNGGGGLTVNVSASATSGRAPIDVTFSSDVHGGDGAYRYLWNFGDGRTSTAANTTVQFPTGGTFNVTLQVTSGDEAVTSAPIALNFESDVRVTCSSDPSEGIAP